MKSKAFNEQPLHVGDIVEVYTKNQQEKIGSWSAPKKILSVIDEARSITVPGKDQRTNTISIYYIRPATPSYSLSKTVQEGIYSLGELLEDLTDKN